MEVVHSSKILSRVGGWSTGSLLVEVTVALMEKFVFYNSDLKDLTRLDKIYTYIKHCELVYGLGYRRTICLRRNKSISCSWGLAFLHFEKAEILHVFSAYSGILNFFNAEVCYLSGNFKMPK